MEKRSPQEQLIFEAKKKEFQRLAGLLNESEGMAPMAEDGMAAAETEAHPGYPELDRFIERTVRMVHDIITKQLGQNPDDHEFPFKADYALKGIIKMLGDEIQPYHHIDIQ